MKDTIPAETLSAALPFDTEEERFAWHLRRRIGAVGMLWNKPSDAFLGLRIKAAERAAAFGVTDGSVFGNGAGDAPGISRIRGRRIPTGAAAFPLSRLRSFGADALPGLLAGRKRDYVPAAGNGGSQSKHFLRSARRRIAPLSGLETSQGFRASHFFLSCIGLPLGWSFFFLAVHRRDW